ncbi:MAG: hypothetical protein KJ941_09120 [Bacteroidetes bacterium]|nr:hypothetical protein [Bacteroidota bacterium]
MKRVGILLILLCLVACTEGIEIKLLEPYPIFHGNSSKFWVINKVKRKGKNYSPTPIRQKDGIIFFANEKFMIQPIELLGEMPQKTGAFFLNMKQQECNLNFQKEKWVFKILELSINKIILRPKSNSDFPFELELITYPAPL